MTTATPKTTPDHWRDLRPEFTQQACWLAADLVKISIEHIAVYVGRKWEPTEDEPKTRWKALEPERKREYIQLCHADAIAAVAWLYGWLPRKPMPNKLSASEVYSGLGQEPLAMVSGIRRQFAGNRFYRLEEQTAELFQKWPQLVRLRSAGEISDET